MRSIPPLNIQDGKLFTDISNAKREPRCTILNGLKAAVVANYKAYVASVPDVQNCAVTTVTDDQKNALIHAFEVETAPMLKLRGRLLDRKAASFCPFCNIGQSTTLDHYLPKDTYPTLSVYSRNLVPCCGTCNSLKTTLVLDKAVNVRAFYHPYFDVIPTDLFLQVQHAVHVNTITLKFKVFKPAGMSTNAFNQLNSHFTKLGLAKKFRLRALDHLEEQLPAFRREHHAGGHTAVAASLLTDACDLEISRGRNHWRVVLYKALAADQAFCNEGFNVIEQTA